MKMRIFHHRSKCIGCNACVEANYDRWRMSRKDGKSVLINGEDINGIFSLETEIDEWESNVIAVENCPVKIIKVEKVA